MTAAHTITVSTPELAVLASLVGLGVAVMQNDSASGMGFVEALSTPEIEAVAKGLTERIGAAVRAIQPEAQT